MKTEFKTEIVKTKAFNKTLVIVFGILYLISTYYIFLYDKENQNIFFKYAALTIYIIGIYFLFGQSFIKPKKIGTLKISHENIEFDVFGNNALFSVEELEKISLRYMDYGSWTTHSIYGNRNRIKITEKLGTTHDFEILIKNKVSKNILKQILYHPEYHNKFNVIKEHNSRTEF